MKMEAAARVIQASWKYYQVRQKCNHQKPTLLANTSKKVTTITGLASNVGGNSGVLTQLCHQRLQPT